MTETPEVEKPVKVEEAPKVVVEEEIIGISLDDYFKDKTVVGRKAAREAEGIKGTKVAQDDITKDFVGT